MVSQVNLELLKELFPGQVNIGYQDALKVVGVNVRTGFNNPGKYFPSFLIGRRRFVAIPVLAAWLDGVQGVAQQAEDQHQRRPGRPRKGC